MARCPSREDGEERADEWAQGFCWITNRDTPQAPSGSGSMPLACSGVKLDSGRGRSGTGCCPSMMTGVRLTNLQAWV